MAPTPAQPWVVGRFDDAHRAGQHALAEASDAEFPRLETNLAWYASKAA